MDNVNHFIRFFDLSDCMDAHPVTASFPLNGELPTTKHGRLPVLSGDVLRFLVAQSDLGGRQPEAVDLRLLNVGTDTLLPGTVGVIRRQDAESYSEIKIRVNAGVADGDYRQFALLTDIPNPAYAESNLALGRTAQVSSSIETSTISLSYLTNAESPVGTEFWSSDGDSLNQHDEFIIMPLAERSTVKTLRLYPRLENNGLTSLHFPVDMVAEISEDNGQTFRFVRRWVGIPPVTNGKPVEFTLPANVRATHVRLLFSSLAYNPADSSYRVQFSELAMWGYPDSVTPTVEANLLGTFRGQATTLPDYIGLIRTFLEAYPYTPVTVDEDGNELTIRIFHSGRFQLGNALIRVGLGKVNEQNENQPVMTTRFKATIVEPAQTRYRVGVGNDIEQGNVYTLGTVTYTAAGNETPAAILIALGVTGGTVAVAAGTVPLVSAAPGTYTQTNTNKPTITVLYDSTAGGNDQYRVIVGSSVAEGNTFQVSVEGQTTRTIIAGPTDTATSIAAYFNNQTGGLFFVGLGKVPVASVIAGTKVVANTNAPGLSLTGRTEISARTLDCWTVYIGTGIQAGNLYGLQVGTGARQIVTAGADDTVLSLAGKFGYSSHPFDISVPAGQSVTAFAEPGPRYRSPDHLADVEVLQGPVLYRNLPWVAEVELPDLTTYDDYSLVLTDLNSSVIRAKTNYLTARPSKSDTMLLRYGDRGPVYGYDYQEAGLVQQLRLPVCLSEGRLQQEETIGKALDGATIRGRTRSEIKRVLTTDMQPESFHRALWAALKHRSVWVNGLKIEQRGEYQQTAATPRKRLMQATADVFEVSSSRSNTADYKPDQSSYQSSGYVLIRSISAPEGLPIYLLTGNITTQIRPGMTLKPGVYKLLVRPGHEKLEVVAYVGSLRALRSVLTPTILNRVDQDLILSAGSVVDIDVRPAATDSPESVAFQEHSAESAFNVEYDSTYFR